MELTADLTAPCSTNELFGWIDDLGRYPEWMGLVHRAEPRPQHVRQPAWDVELRARIGPFARSKRLVMVRTVCAADARVVFERDETDGRRHSMWRLTAAVSSADAAVGPHSEASTLVMTLHYGGSLWTGGVAERVLMDEIERSRDRLLALISPTDAPTR